MDSNKRVHPGGLRSKENADQCTPLKRGVGTKKPQKDESGNFGRGEKELIEKRSVTGAGKNN